MNPGSVSTQRASNPVTKLHREAGTRLNGRGLVLLRGAWIALVIFCLMILVVGLPAYFTFLRTVCIPAMCHEGQTSSETIKTLHALGLSLNFYVAFNLGFAVVTPCVCFVVGMVIFWRKSDDWMALLVALLLITSGVDVTGITSALEYSPGFLAWHLPALLVDFLSIGLYPLVFGLFPDGRFVPRWAPWMLGVFVVGFLTSPFFLDPLALPAPEWVKVLGVLLLGGDTILIIIAQLYRYRHVSGPIQRQQTKWVMFGLIVLLTEFLVYLPTLIVPSLSPSSSILSLLFIVVFPPTVVFVITLTFSIAILRYRLWDIDIIINRTLVYGMLTACVVGIYVLVVVLLGTLLQARGNIAISLLATGLIAMLFQPLRDRLQRAVNRLMYGERDEPYRVISRLGQRLEATLAPEAILPTIVETVAMTLKLPYAAIALKEEDILTPAASFGASREGEDLVRLPLVAQHELVGELVLAPRAPGEAFTPADQRLLEDLSRQIGVAVYAVRLTVDLKRLTIDLQRSRERLVTAREEERRRLRRDLHDGLGPQLASLTLKLETARNRLAHDPLADTLLSDLAQRTQATVADIRHLVYALRPPALDELGLVSALHELTLQHSDQIVMHLDAPTCLPELPAAVEVAIYRIAQEALTNVVRHAHARHCDLQLILDEKAGWLSLSLQDDGSGLLPSRSAGVGLVSMRERAEELGGTCTIEPVESGGTRVLVRLPLVLSETTDELVVIPTGVPQEEE